MNLNIKQVGLICLLVAAMSFAAIVVAKKVVFPILSKNHNYSSEVTYQKALENRVEENVADLLRKLYGKNNYFVSVVIDLHETSEVIETVIYEPVVISENRVEMIEGAFESFRNALFEDKPSAQEIRYRLAERFGDDIVAPGLVNSASESSGAAVALPGFPVISTLDSDGGQNLTDYLQASSFEPSANVNEGDPESAESVGEDSSRLQRELVSERVVYNQTKKTQETPFRKVDRLLISVLVDQTRFELAEVSQNVLEGHIQTIASLDAGRGDELNISILPFPDRGFDLGTTMLKAKKQAGIVGDAMAKFKLPLLIVGAVLVIAGLAAFAYYMRLQMQKRRAEELLAQETVEVEEVDGGIDESVSEVEQKRDDIVKLAKEKPGDFAQVIINWVEKSVN